MNENLLQKLTEVGDKIVTAIQTGLDQAPAYIQDLAHRRIELQLRKRSVSLFLSITVFAFSVWRVIYLVNVGRREQDNHNDWSGYYMGAFVVSLIPVVFIFFIYSDISGILGYSIVPELYIIQDIREFLR